MPPTGQITDFTLASASQSYDTLGRFHKQTDVNGLVTDYTYDSLGRPTVVELPSDGTTRDKVTTVYDALGRPEKTETTTYDPLDRADVRVTESAFDGWGRVRKSVGAPGSEDLVATYELDALGRTTRSVSRWQASALPDDPLDSNDRVREIEYDSAGRVEFVKVREQATPTEIWATTLYEYDKDGLLEKMTDAEGNTTDWAYDPLGRVERMLYPTESGERQTVEMVAYDKNNNPEKVQYRKHNDPAAPYLEWTMQYDVLNRLESRQAAFGNGGKTLFSFSGATQQDFTYDDLGRIVKAVDHSAAQPSGTENIEVEFGYDSAGRVLSENQRLPRLDGSTPVVRDHLVTSEYAPDGFRTELKFPQVSPANTTRYTLTYVPDTLRRLHKIEGPPDPKVPSGSGLELATYTYQGSRVWERGYANDTALRYFDESAQGTPSLYDDAGRATGMRIVDTSSPTPPIAQFEYGFDRVGNLTYEQRLHEPFDSPADSYRTRAITNDLMGRLGAWAEGSLGIAPVAGTETDPAGLVSTASDSESWVLDQVGNWDSRTFGPSSGTTEDYVINALNQYDSVDPGGEPTTFDFDWLGQLRYDEEKDEYYVWDAFGRLSEIRVGSKDGSIKASYRYDGFNRRVYKKWPSGPAAMDLETWFIYDGWRAIEERALLAGTEKVRARYGFGNGLDEVLWMDRDVPRDENPDGDPNPVSGSTDDTVEARFFLHHDRLGSVVAVTDTSATVVERFTYSAYGEVSAWSNPSWNSAQGTYPTSDFPAFSEVGLPYLYTGQRLDRESGLYYYKYRVHDPSRGRFISRDPVGYHGGTGLYQYVGSNPLDRVDPLGLVGSSAAHAPDFCATHPDQCVQVLAERGQITNFDRPSGANQRIVYLPAPPALIAARGYYVWRFVNAPRKYLEDDGREYYLEALRLYDAFKKAAESLGIEFGEFVDRTAEALHVRLEEALQDDPSIETDRDRLYDAAIDTHSQAYRDGGYRNLSSWNQWQVVFTIGVEPLLQFESWREFLEVYLED